VPEGDTIFRLARTLNRALAGQTVASFESVYPSLTHVSEDSPAVWRTIVGARSAGKHLLLEFSGGLVLRTHRRMYGRVERGCRRCGTRINCRKQGPEARLTYWCPRCQR
jgi:formamidopyrimidine-DNA glycosylase